LRHDRQVALAVRDGPSVKWFWIAFATGFEIVGDYFLKKWSLTNNWKDFLLGILIYSTGNIGWAFLLKMETLQRAILFFAVVNVVATILVGHFAFGESLGFRGVCGMVFAIVAIALLEF